MTKKEAIETLTSEYSVSRETITKIESFIELLLKWNRSINLMSQNEEYDIWHRHILDCCQLIDILKVTKNTCLVDFGTGSGFPGIIISLILDFKEIHLIESVSKKAIFLTEAAKLSKNKITIHNDRIEKLPSLNADIITARAFADIDSTIKYSSYHSHDNTKLFSFKGKRLPSELDTAYKKWDFKHILHKSKILEDSSIIEISDIKRKI